MVSNPFLYMLKCNNYYSMPRSLILSKLEAMKLWLFNNESHPKRKQVEFAFIVANLALEDLDQESRMIIDILCNSLDNKESE